MGILKYPKKKKTPVDKEGNLNREVKAHLISKLTACEIINSLNHMEKPKQKTMHHHMKVWHIQKIVLKGSMTCK